MRETVRRSGLIALLIGLLALAMPAAGVNAQYGPYPAYPGAPVYPPGVPPGYPQVLPPAGVPTAAVTAPTAAATATTVAVMAPAAPAAPDTIYAITPNNLLLRFSILNPRNVDFIRPITGLQPGETLLGIDFRPANKQLYGIGGTSRIYLINQDTGVATAVGTGPFSPRIVGRVYGFDFNPVADAIRLESSEGQNLRISPTTGQVLGNDTNTAYASIDTNAGKKVAPVGAAYTNPVAGATTTQLYIIDGVNDTLALQDPPNAGTLRTVGKLGGGAGGYVGFDITPDGNAVVSFSVATNTIINPFSPFLGRVDLKTGNVQPISPIGENISGLEIVGIAVQLR